MSPADPFKGVTVDASALAKMRRAISEATMPKATTDWPLTTMPSPPTYATAYVLTDADVARIASAVADELERRAAHPLWVSPADHAKVTK